MVYLVSFLDLDTGRIYSARIRRRSRDSAISWVMLCLAQYPQLAGRYAFTSCIWVKLRCSR